MYVHIAIYKWKSDTPANVIDSALNEVKLLKDKVPGIIEISWGENTSKYGEGFTHVILVRAENQEAVEAYRKHPDHDIVAHKIETIEDSGIGVDFTPK